MSPNPTGIVIYGNFNPNVNADATARRSNLILSNNTNNGGIKIGINAICTGTIFCEKHAIIAIENANTNFLPESWIV